MEKVLYKIAKELQIVMEEVLKINTVGTCYLSGHCLALIFIQLGYESRKVTGRLALLMKGGKGKYATYGRLPYKSKQIGVYHTWCEVEINNEIFIVDPSLKANIEFTKKCFKIKIHPMAVHDTLVTKTGITYYYKYQEDNILESHSNESLRTLVTPQTINNIINITLDRVRDLEQQLSA